jgi:hypothetical protein
LPKVWADACRALDAWPGWHIGFWDYSEAEVCFYGMDPERMSWLFDTLGKIAKLNCKLNPLIDAYPVDPDSFWASLIQHLTTIAGRYPELIADKKRA